MIHYVRIYDPGTAVDYVHGKLELAGTPLASYNRAGAASEIAERVKTGEPAPSLAAPDQLPPHSARKRDYLVQRANIEGPLVDGETPAEDDFASYLLADFRGIPAGTVALRRRTNRAEYYYFLPCFHVRDGQIHRVRTGGTGAAADGDTALPEDDRIPAPPKPGEAARAVVPAGPAALPEGFTIWGELALSLANALVGGIGDAIGTRVFDLLFGKLASVPSWFGEMYEKFVKAVYEAFNDQWKKQIEVEIRTVADEVDLYNRTGNKAQLQQAENLSVRLVQDIQVFGPSLVANYMTAAGLQLMVLQQQALVAENPAGYMKAIEDRADRFSEWALTSRTTVINGRMAKITKVEPIKSGQTQGWGFQDNASGEKWWYPDIPSVGKSGKPNADRAYAIHIENVNSSINRDLQPVLLITGEWLKLVQQPLPPHKPTA